MLSVTSSYRGYMAQRLCNLDVLIQLGASFDVLKYFCALYFAEYLQCKERWNSRDNSRDSNHSNSYHGRVGAGDRLHLWHLRKKKTVDYNLLYGFIRSFDNSVFQFCLPMVLALHDLEKYRKCHSLSAIYPWSADGRKPQHRKCLQNALSFVRNPFLNFAFGRQQLKLGFRYQHLPRCDRNQHFDWLLHHF